MSREHAHTHPHTHTHEGVGDLAHSTALLSYMLDHNCHHAEELHMAAHSLEDFGKAEAAELIFKAVEDFEKANEKLKSAIELLK